MWVGFIDLQRVIRILSIAAHDWAISVYLDVFLIRFLRRQFMSCALVILSFIFAIIFVWMDILVEETCLHLTI